MKCTHCFKPLEIINNSRRIYADYYQCDLWVCADCDTFYAYSTEEPIKLIQYWFVCTEITK